VIISGSYTFNAPPDLVWSLLHNNETIRQVLPGCEHFHLHADGKYHVLLNTQSGPFSGGYEGVVTRLGERPNEEITLALTGSGPELALSGGGTLSLEEIDGQTLLQYEGDVDVSGQIPSRSPRLTRTTANYMVRSFMEALDQQLSQITGIPVGNGRPAAAPIPIERTTPTIGMEEFLAEVRRDRLVAVSVFFILLFLTFSAVGAIFLAFLLLRWLTRLLTGDD
jgi:carbon monoxide dehydrogenase subunit G